MELHKRFALYILISTECLHIHFLVVEAIPHLRNKRRQPIEFNVKPAKSIKVSELLIPEYSSTTISKTPGFVAQQQTPSQFTNNCCRTVLKTECFDKKISYLDGLHNTVVTDGNCQLVRVGRCSSERATCSGHGSCRTQKRAVRALIWYRYWSSSFNRYVTKLAFVPTFIDSHCECQNIVY